MEMQRLGLGLVVLRGGGHKQQEQPAKKQHQSSGDRQGSPDSPAAVDKDAVNFVHCSTFSRPDA